MGVSIFACLIIFRRQLGIFTKLTKLPQKYPKAGMDIVLIILICGLSMHLLGLLMNWSIWLFFSLWLIAIGIAGVVPFGRGWKMPKGAGLLKEFLVYAFSLFIPIFVLIFGMAFSQYYFGTNSLFGDAPRWYWLLQSILIFSFGLVGFKIANNMRKR